MYAIFIFNTLKVGEPIFDRKAKFYCRTLGVEPTLLDVASRLTESIGNESMYTKQFYAEDFKEVLPGIHMKYLDWNQTIIMAINTRTMSRYNIPQEIFTMTLRL